MANDERSTSLAIIISYPTSMSEIILLLKTILTVVGKSCFKLQLF